MYLKNPNQVQLRFFVEDPVTKKEVVVPADGRGASSISELAKLVILQFIEYDRVTNGEFTKKSRKEASELKLQYSNFITKVVQHQICLRVGGEDPMRICYNDGIGDRLHEFAGKVDKVVAAAPRAVRVVGQALTKIVTKGSRTLRGCNGCGGTKTFRMGDKRTLGRAGKVNEVMKGGAN